MNFLKKNLNGILVCFVIAVPSWLLGKTFPVVGGPVIAILAGMLITLVWTNKGKAESGIKWTSKIILQTAVVLLGFGMNLGVILQTGKQSLPIIVCTISTSLIIAWLLRKIIKVPSNTSILSVLPSAEDLRSLPPHRSLMQMIPKLHRQFPLSSSSTSLQPYFSRYLEAHLVLTQQAVDLSDYSQELRSMIPLP